MCSSVTPPAASRTTCNWPRASRTCGSLSGLRFSLTTLPRDLSSSSTGSWRSCRSWLHPRTRTTARQTSVNLSLLKRKLSQLQQLLDVVSLVAVGRSKNDEEANSLIKIRQEYCMDLYMLLNPLLFWLDFAVEREERLQLFKNSLRDHQASHGQPAR